jgi:cellulose synthase/poly-beta-1,6-N-acetylglucosamine synthase-like glycosyltransferase
VLGGKYLGAKIKEKYHDSPFVREVDYPLQEWKVVYSKSMRAWTEVPDTWRRMLKQQIRWKKSFLRSTFFTGKFYWRKPFPTALMFYLHILFVFVGPFIVFRHLIYLPLRGNVLSGVLYISGILFIGLLFAFAHKKEDPTSRYWVYRPLMNIISTFFLSWLVFYSAVTIRKMTWSRG